MPNYMHEPGRHPGLSELAAYAPFLGLQRTTKTVAGPANVATTRPDSAAASAAIGRRR